MAKQEITCDDILKELRAKQYRPVYYLMGEEPYYIDLIADYITDNILTETEKEFNLTVVYGADVDIATVINAAKRYPMMSEHQVVVVKEAQNIRNMGGEFFDGGRGNVFRLFFAAHGGPGRQHRRVREYYGIAPSYRHNRQSPFRFVWA